MQYEMTDDETESINDDDLATSSRTDDHFGVFILITSLVLVGFLLIDLVGR